ncbi:hypothetical protein [Granulosicoccus antarcticus]|uniref:Uncharacterized protein n=1 Tax=Granulosicoccus antarcticus IMCC3135 TaxID=1192854 RepID=A0A2Z2P7F8_9GAMM|nr:hypothetical protein [Granulosicoccus antarcticus]ASJ76627.1 hypothetical protein IMCC3135_32915 [Granulosicoccus antarcticus IMCC3135]
MPELTERAQKYLGSLERRVPVPVADVRQALIDHGYPVLEVWLDFHDRYAGYCETLGEGGTTWGLKHADTRYSLMNGRPFEVEAYRDEADGLWTIEAADSHPSFDQTMDENGEFQHIPASSFEIHLERAALFQQYMDLGAKPYSQMGYQRISQLKPESSEAERVEAASDKYIEWWQGKKYIAARWTETGEWLSAFVKS